MTRRRVIYLLYKPHAQLIFYGMTMNHRLHFFTYHAFPICPFNIAASCGNNSHQCLSFEALTIFALTPFASSSPSRELWECFAAELWEPVIFPKLNDSQSSKPYFYQETKELVRQEPEPAILVSDQPPPCSTIALHIRRVYAFLATSLASGTIGPPLTPL